MKTKEERNDNGRQEKKTKINISNSINSIHHRQQKKNKRITKGPPTFPSWGTGGWLSTKDSIPRTKTNVQKRRVNQRVAADRSTSRSCVKKTRTNSTQKLPTYPRLLLVAFLAHCPPLFPTPTWRTPPRSPYRHSCFLPRPAATFVFLTRYSLDARARAGRSRCVRTRRPLPTR